MTLFRALIACLLLSLAAGPVGPVAPAFAQETQASAEESVSKKLERWDSEATEIERRLELEDPDLDDLSQMRATLEAQLSAIPATREQVRTRLKPLQDQRAALGDAPEDASTEAPQITLERQRLDGEISEIEARLKRVDQAQARAEGLVQRITTLRRDQFTARLLTRGPSLLDTGMPEAAIAALRRTSGIVLLETQTRLRNLDTASPRVIWTGIGIALALLAVGGLVKLRRHVIRRLVNQVTEETPRSRRVAAGLGIGLARLLLPIVSLSILFGAIWASGLVGGQGETFLAYAAQGAWVVIAAYALGGGVFAPKAPLLRLSALGNTDAVCAHRWLVMLAGIVALDRAFVQGGQEMGVAVEGLALLNSVVLVLGGLTLAKFLRHIRPPAQVEASRADACAAAARDEEDEEDADADATDEHGRPRQSTSLMRTLILFLRVTGVIVAVAAPVLAVLGYYAAARFVFFPLIFSFAVILAMMLLYHIAKAVVEQILLGDAAEDGEQHAAGEPGSERLRLIPIAVGFVLFCAALPVLGLIWGADPSDLAMVWRMVVTGFQIGEVEIAPLDFVIFAAVLVIGVAITRRLKLVLRRNVLPFTGLDAGGRDAVAAGAGYVGIVVAALVAISSAGIDLSNLAIVAGALSVGIGFGLQNIVNNFVSGIILLIERPIKAGDWIQIPSGMGYVKTINVRSTEVETFDRSSLFVPNSQLISEAVINWTHSNAHGRVIAKARVAHGSDPRKVERILLEIARAHPLMLRRPAPFVLFRGYDTDALLFEVRGILRDVNWVLNVESDIHFEIARRFAEEGIRVPVSQSDIYLRGGEDVAAHFAEKLGPGWPDVPDRRASHGPESAAVASTGGRAPTRLHPEPARDPDAGGAGDGR